METKKREIVKNYVLSYNNFDIEGMTKYLAKNIVFENISNGKVNLKTEGLEAFKEQATIAKEYFKQREQNIESWEIQDSTITIEISYKAILAIDLPNGLKIGDTLELKGVSHFEFENGKIKRITDKS
ncbi:HlyD family secretion protein [Tenacibaculum sp. 190130A14a]|uniref:SnoaL-like domain-containing protein n=1 Tax=Tenacibaculum polynesiense TaxID=3137857 RepID=A0ABM9P827_9FLAO